VSYPSQRQFAWLAAVLSAAGLTLAGCELALPVDRTLANGSGDAGEDAAADGGGDASEPGPGAMSDDAESGADAAPQDAESPDSAAPPCLDSDGDGVCNFSDVCPTIANGDQQDSDRDNVGDLCDACPDDPRKVLPGMCGCGAGEEDKDGDGRANCVDGCPEDSAKTASGLCGCGVADADHDGDGAIDCQESCPDDPTKLSAGVCGCGVADTDVDADGLINCLDPCPIDNPDDTDHDGVCDSRDVCIGDDASGDTDQDGLCDDGDPCPDNAALTDCAGSCVDLRTDHDHCGSCPMACANDETCSASHCLSAGAPLSFTVSWTEASANLDLYVRTPAGHVIYHGNPQQDGGTKYTDSASGPGAEQIVWQASPPTGTYEVCVVGFMLSTDTGFRLEVAELGNVAQSISGTARVADANMSVATCAGGDSHHVLSFSY
jgi:hypothetical protein